MFFVVVALLIALLSGFLGYWLARRAIPQGTQQPVDPRAEDLKAPKDQPGGKGLVAAPPPMDLTAVDDPAVSGDLVVLDDQGNALLMCRELEVSPNHLQTMDAGSSQAVDRMRQLVTDVVGRGLTMPGKTVEILFDPKVQEGLSNGAYEIVKVAKGDGHRLMARAIEGKKFVGQGRFIEAGQLRQIGVGAFHLVSIAVAQAHLAEINKNLEIIKEGVKDIRDFLEAKDIADLAGTVDYLEYLVGFIRRLDTPDSMPQEKRNQLEHIRREIMSWSVQIIEEARRCQTKIEAQQSLDRVGSEKNLNALRDHGKSCEAIVRKYKLLMRMASLFYSAEAYLSPLHLKVQEHGIRIESKELDKALFDMLASLNKKSEVLLQSKVLAEETLRKERKEITDRVNELDGVRRSLEGIYAAQVQRIRQQLLGLQSQGRGLKMAVTFDANGKPCDVLMVE